MQNPSQEPSVSSDAWNKDLEDMDVLCLVKAELLWANLRQTKYLIKLSFSELIPTGLSLFIWYEARPTNVKKQAQLSWDQLREAQLLLGIQFVSDWLREALLLSSI